MIAVYALIACFIAWIWIDYFRLIEVYGKEDLRNILITFFLGAASVLIALALEGYWNLDLIPLHLNGDMWNDFLYCFFKIGLVEEFAKMVPYIFMYICFRSIFKEPIDYVAFAAISALGFAAAEDTLYFINHHGEVISARAILTSIGHMFYSALIGYGIVLTKYRNKASKYKFLILPGFILLAIFSHAFYDFWMINGGGHNALISILFFMLTVSWYSTILNNSLNNDSGFSYKRTINSPKVMNRILAYYAIVFAIQFTVNTYEKDANRAAGYFVTTFQSSVIILLSVSVRLSRFTLIQGRWQPIKLELPFRYNSGDGIFGIGVAVKGDSFLDTVLDKYYEEYFIINPLSKNATLGTPKFAYIESKLFIKNDESLHIARIFKDETRAAYDLFLLKPKTKDKTEINDKYPIAALFRYKDLDGEDLTKLTVKDFGFIEWVYITPFKDNTKTNLST